MENNNNEEFIKIETDNITIDKKTISSLISKANKFFDSFENFAQKVNQNFNVINHKLDYLIESNNIINKKLDYLIESQSRKDNGINNQPKLLLNPKEKQPEDTKSQHISKKSENVSASASIELFNEENDEGLVYSEGPADSISNENIKNIVRKNNQNILSTYINSQFLKYKNNINESIDNNNK